MGPVLSILDPSPVFDGTRPKDALADSRALAEAGDRLGYRAVWVQEHHNAPSFAGTAPEILIADLAARTNRIAIGSGGVMLPNYSPLKVAEQFATLSALAPGRIELGIGRATGADPRTAAALLGPGAESFPQMLRLLMDWLLDASGDVPLRPDHRAFGIHANPPAPHPELWMLTSSASSAAVAGAMGLKLAYAEFLGPGGAHEAIDAYRDAFAPSPFAAEPHAGVGLTVLAADTDAEAARLAVPLQAWNSARKRGRFIPFPMPDAAAAAGMKGTGEDRHAEMFGDGPSVAAALEDFAARTGADELFLLTIAPRAERIRSYELIRQAMTVTG